MANKKNTVAEDNVVEEVVYSKITPAKTKRAQARKFNPTDTFPCRSVTYGELILEGMKSKLLYTWSNAGDYTDVEFQDLQALQSRKSSFLTTPLFIIEDDELVEYWGDMLNPIYSKIEEADLDALLKLPANKLKAKLKSAPEGIKKSVKTMAAAMITSGEFDSINRIKAIDEVLGTELITLIS